MTGPQVRLSSSYQGGRTGQGKEVVACKSGGHSLLLVEAGKIEVNIIRELFLTSSYFWTTIIKRLPWFYPQNLGFHVKTVVYCAFCCLYTY